MVYMGPSHPEATVYWDDDILSDVALGEIGQWVRSQPMGTKRMLLTSIYMVHHRTAFEATLIPTVIEGFTIQTLLCHDVGCNRCGSGPPWDPNPPARGGWRFQWRGPWTADSLVPAGHTPNSWRHELRARAIRRQATTTTMLARSQIRSRPGGG